MEGTNNVNVANMSASSDPEATLVNISAEDVGKENSKGSKRAAKLYRKTISVALGLFQTRKLRKVDSNNRNKANNKNKSDKKNNKMVPTLSSVFTPKKNESVARDTLIPVANDVNKDEMKLNKVIPVSSLSQLQQPHLSKIDNKMPTPLLTTNLPVGSNSVALVATELPKKVFVHDDVRNKDYSEYLLEPLHSYLLLGTHDVIIPLNTNTFTCPKCHAPHAVHYVHEDPEKGHSKNLYICLVNGLSGCGWEDTSAPVEEDIRKEIKASIGFNPLILN